MKGELTVAVIHEGHAVYVGKKRVGTIKKVDGFQFFWKKQKEGGKIYPDFRDCVASVNGEKLCYCGNCSWKGVASKIKVKLEEIPDLGQRLDPGSEVPVGECPACNCLAYEEKD